MRLQTRLVLGIAGTLLSAGTTLAQNPAATTRSPVSPYLNIIPRRDPALNYFGIVRPQLRMEQRQAILGRRVDELDEQTRPMPESQTRSLYDNYTIPLPRTHAQERLEENRTALESGAEAASEPTYPQAERRPRSSGRIFNNYSHYYSNSRYPIMPGRSAATARTPQRGPGERSRPGYAPKSPR